MHHPTAKNIKLSNCFNEKKLYGQFILIYKRQKLVNQLLELHKRDTLKFKNFSD